MLEKMMGFRVWVRNHLLHPKVARKETAGPSASLGMTSLGEVAEIESCHLLFVAGRERINED